MTKPRPEIQDEESLSMVWDPHYDRRCIVCNGLTDGKAICTDARCAQELAHG